MRKKKRAQYSKAASVSKKSDLLEMLSVKKRNADLADILAALADGYNPITGEKFRKQILDQPEILLALTAGSAALRNIASKTTFVFSDTSSRKPPENAVKPWTQQDDAILLEAYNNNEPIDMLAIDFGRHEYEIIDRLEKLLNITIYKQKQLIKKPEKIESSD